MPSLCLLPLLLAQQADPAPAVFTAEHVFGLEYAADPRISPDGERVVYVRSSFDIRTACGYRSNPGPWHGC